MKVVALLLRDEWGALQRVLGLLTRKRVHVDAVMATPQPGEGTLRVLLGSGDLRLAQMIAALQRLDPVQEAVLLEGWSDVLWAVPTGLRSGAPTVARPAGPGHPLDGDRSQAGGPSSNSSSQQNQPPQGSQNHDRQT